MKPIHFGFILAFTLLTTGCDLGRPLLDSPRSNENVVSTAGATTNGTSHSQSPLRFVLDNGQVPFSGQVTVLQPAELTFSANYSLAYVAPLTIGAPVGPGSKTYQLEAFQLVRLVNSSYSADRYMYFHGATTVSVNGLAEIVEIDLVVGKYPYGSTHYPWPILRVPALSLQVQDVTVSEYANFTLPPMDNCTLPPGDYQRDGIVDAKDHRYYLNHYGDQVAAYTGADGNGDGVVETGDYIVWRQHQGETLTCQ